MKRPHVLRCPYCGAPWHVEISLGPSRNKPKRLAPMQCHGCLEILDISIALKPTLKPGQVVTPAKVKANQANIKKRYEK